MNFIFLNSITCSRFNGCNLSLRAELVLVPFV